jgi:probable rRNA maturation factor
MKTKVHQLPTVEVRNLQRKIALGANELEEFARKAMACSLCLPNKGKSNLTKLNEILILIISDRRMAALHRRFKNKAGPTDVLTFQHGEIFISAETALRNARRFGSTMVGEVELYIVHGLLHLQGFDDRNPADTRKMRAAEKKILHRLRR